MPRKTDTARNQAIAHRLYVDKAPAVEVAREFGLSRQQVYKSAEAQLRADLHAAGSPQETPSVPIGPLYSQITKTGLRRYGGTVDDDYNRVFRTLYKRVQLFREMGDDPIVAAVLQAVKMRLRSVGWYVETDGETDADKEARDFVQQCLDDMSQTWADTIDQALDMIQYGFQPAELVYKLRKGYKPDAGSKYDDGRVGWRKWTFISQDSLQQGSEWIFDENGGVQGIRQCAPPDYKLVELSIEKAILFRTSLQKNNPEGRALLRAMYSPWYYKKNLEELEAISYERMGTGLPVIYAGSDVVKSKDRNKDLGALERIATNVRLDEQMGVTFPYAKMGGGAAEGEGVLFELLAPSGKSSVDFNVPITRHEQRMTMVGLAQFIHLGMNQVGARSLGENLTDFFDLSLAGWLDNLGQTIDRYAVDRLMRLNNFPGLTCNPYMAHESITGTNLKELADTINTLASAEVITPNEELERHVLELLDLPQGERIAEVWAKKAERQDAAPVAPPPPQFGNKPEAPDDAPSAPEAEPVDQEGNGEDAMSIQAIHAALLELRKMDTDRGEVDKFAALLAGSRGGPSLVIEQATFANAEGVEMKAPDVRPTIVVQPPDMTPIAEALERISARPEPAAPVIHVSSAPNPPAQITVTPQFNVPSPTVINNPAPVNVTVEMPETQEITEVKRDDQGYITQTIKTHRKAKN